MTQMIVANRPTLLLSTLLVFASWGCAAGSVLRAADPPNLTTHEGLLAVEVDDATCPLVLGLCHEADLDQCMSVGPIEHTQRLVMAKLPAGRACINRVECARGNAAVTWDIDSANATCVDIEAGRIAYPGDFVLTTQAVGNSSFENGHLRFSKKDGLAARVAAAYPLLRDVEVHQVEPRPFKTP
ncbi:MAG TPA: hypothetical protein VGO62_21890 [Myxococcota bacterium]